jgi:Ferritin-like domain
MTSSNATPVATGRTRGQALRAAAAGGAALGAAALAGAWTRPSASAGRASPAQDVRILNFLLILEEAQAGLYEAALRAGGVTGDLLEFARVVAPQEREHVALLRKRLGNRAAAAPRLGFGDAVTDPRSFRATAIDLEEQTAAAYIGQGPSLTGGPMQDAARIVAVEARHAAWILDLAGRDPAPRPADPASRPQDVLANLRAKGILR